MKKSLLLAASFAVLGSVPAHAALVGDFRLDGSTTNLAGGPLTLTNNGGTLGATGITFAAGRGPSITGFSNTGIYSVEVVFRLDQLSSYRRLLEFKNGVSDYGLYSLNQRTNFYPFVTSASVDFDTTTERRLVFTRDAANTAVAYVGNGATISFNDAGSDAVINNRLAFFNDDGAISGEQSSGFVDYIRIYDTALSASQVAALTPPGSIGAVPEPASWALIIAGFGLVGGAMRRRSSPKVTYA